MNKSIPNLNIMFDIIMRLGNKTSKKVHSCHCIPWSECRQPGETDRDVEAAD